MLQNGIKVEPDLHTLLPQLILVITQNVLGNVPSSDGLPVPEHHGDTASDGLPAGPGSVCQRSGPPAWVGRLPDGSDRRHPRPLHPDGGRREGGEEEGIGQHGECRDTGTQGHWETGRTLRGHLRIRCLLFK